MDVKENNPHRIILLKDATLYIKTQALTRSCLTYYKDVLNNDGYNNLALMLFKLNSKLAKAFATASNKKSYVAHINYALNHFLYMQELFANPPLSIQEQLDDINMINIKFKTKYKKELNINDNTI